MLWFLGIVIFSILKSGLPHGRRTLTEEADRQGWYLGAAVVTGHPPAQAELQSVQREDLGLCRGSWESASPWSDRSCEHGASRTRGSDCTGKGRHHDP